jgi:hypothetical protein
MKKLILLVFIIIVSTAYAATDYTCMSDCQKKGYTYQLCLEQCSYGNDKPKKADQYYPAYPLNTQPRTEPKCMADCQGRGYVYQYCQKACSY